MSAERPGTDNVMPNCPDTERRHQRPAVPPLPSTSFASGQPRTAAPRSLALTFSPCPTPLPKTCDSDILVLRPEDPFSHQRTTRLFSQGPPGPPEPPALLETRARDRQEMQTPGVVRYRGGDKGLDPDTPEAEAKSSCAETCHSSAAYARAPGEPRFPPVLPRGKGFAIWYIRNTCQHHYTEQSQGQTGHARANGTGLNASLPLRLARSQRSCSLPSGASAASS